MGSTATGFLTEYNFSGGELIKAAVRGSRFFKQFSIISYSSSSVYFGWSSKTGVSAMLALSRVVIHAFDLEYCNMLVIQH